MKKILYIIMIIFTLSGFYTCGTEEYYGPQEDNPEDFYDIQYKITCSQTDPTLYLSYTYNQDRTDKTDIQTMTYTYSGSPEMPLTLDLVPDNVPLPPDFGYCCSGKSAHDAAQVLTFSARNDTLDADLNSVTLTEIKLQIIVDGIVLVEQTQANLANGSTVSINTAVNP